MNITVVTEIYKQQGPLLDFYTETQKIYETDVYNGDVISGSHSLLNDFRKHDLFFDTDKVSTKTLYLDGQLVAMLEPRFIIGGESFVTWDECFVFHNCNLAIGDTTVVKQLTNYNRQIIIDILSK